MNLNAMILFKEDHHIARMRNRVREKERDEFFECDEPEICGLT